MKVGVHMTRGRERGREEGRGEEGGGEREGENKEGRSHKRDGRVLLTLAVASTRAVSLTGVRVERSIL